MHERMQAAITPRERFIQLAQEQMAVFEQRERAFRKREREERAAQLNIPLNTDDLR